MGPPRLSMHPPSSSDTKTGKTQLTLTMHLAFTRVTRAEHHSAVIS
jgi:hypothetical protein